MKEFTNMIMELFEIDWGEVKDYLFSLFLTAAATYLFIVTLRFVLHQTFKRTHFLDEKKEQTIESVFRNTSNYILFVVVLIAAIQPFVGNLKEVMLAGGIIAAVIGFGAQKVINDLLSGMFMIFEQTIQKGDFVNINGEPEGGIIEELGFRVVKIRLINGKLVTIPNGEIRKMVNGSVEKRRVFESVIVSFNENPSRVKVLLQEVCDELNERHKYYLKVDKLTGEWVEPYQLYGLHSLDTSPIGYKFSITATVNDTDYLEAAQETKELLAQKIYDHRILMPAQQIVLQPSPQTQEPETSLIK
jgi:moderate conductance mechanosensitive channel